MMRIIFLLLILLVIPLHQSFAQGVGVGALLNPEGTRLFPQSIIFPRHPGKPDLRWKDFHWKYIDLTVQKTQYRLYYYKEELWTAEYAIPRIREQIEYLNQRFGFSPSKKFTYVLFGSQREFQQAHIFDISEGVQGVTSTEEATMAIPYWGEAEVFRHISTHEMTHQFQVQRANELAEALAAETLSFIPLWYIEGMAEFYSLKGLDPETRMYLRDLLLFPDPKNDHKMPNFFDDGPMNYLGVYKVGQAKQDFLETEFGKNTSQLIFESALKSIAKNHKPFASSVSDHVKITPAAIETKWTEYLNRNFKAEAAKLSQSPDDFELVKEAGENLDSFDISPDGTLAAIREIDPLLGTTSINVIDFKDKNRKIEMARDRRPDLLTLHFMQFPVLSIANDRIAYVVSTTSGPEIEIRTFQRNQSGKLEAQKPYRLLLHYNGLTQVLSPALAPKGDRIAFIGLNAQGWQNLYIVDYSENRRVPKFHQLTKEYYSWQALHWGPQGLVAASDRTTNQKYALFAIDPETGKYRPLTTTSPAANHTAPDGTPEDLVYQSWEGGTSQIHHLKNNQDTRLTQIKTGMTSPKRRQGNLYALAFKSGRFHLYKIPAAKTLNQPVPPSATVPPSAPAPQGQAGPWLATTEPIPADKTHTYKAFSSSGIRLDALGGFISSGGFGGVAATVSDLMREYSISAELSVLGSFEETNASAFLSKQAGRTTWTTGAYHVSQERLDSLFKDTVTRTYLHREFGILGALEHPLAAYTYVDAELRLAGVKRSDFSDSTLAPVWDAQNPGSEFLMSPVFRLGYDRILYEMFTGPIKGFGILAEADTSYYPRRQDLSERVRLDVAYYHQATGSMVIATQLMGGASFGGKFPNPFFVSSDDILRAYPFFDDRLRGEYLLAGKIEVRYPIGSLFRFPALRGFVGYDAGTITSNLSYAGRSFSSSYTGGLSINIPPISMSFMLSYPAMIAAGPVERPVTHFTLRYLYL